MNYDDVGNLILDTYTSGLTAGMQYDADNKMTSAANGGQQYRYNADGKRVKRIITGTGGGTYWMVYGLGGELVAEYNATSGIPNTTAPSKEFGYRGGHLLIVAESATVVKWLVQDHLGSTRMEIGVGGAIGDVLRHDYLPFGEELAGTMRSSANGYGTVTNTKQKFTGYERDTETGLDYAQARMYASVQGRFTSVDPDGIGADIGEPQSWNGYAYVGNRPTILTDESGLRWAQQTRADGRTYYRWFNTDAEYNEALVTGWQAVGFDESKPFVFQVACSTVAGGCSGALSASYVLESDGKQHFENTEVGRGAGINVDIMFLMAGPIFSGGNAAITGVSSGINSVWTRLAVRTATQAVTAKVATKSASSIFSYITPKIAKQLARRGWTKEIVHDVVNNPFTTRAATNRATGNGATAFFEKNGSYVVKDNITNEIIQISNKLDPKWIPDATIINPFIP